jgi:DNA excision repair protein ERCC-4
MDLSCIRQIESYKCSRPQVYCRVFTLAYKHSIEEQQFLTTSQREIKAFETMIETKDNLIKNVESEAVENNDFLKWKSIIVDTREFKSELPGMIHRKQLRIEPAMLTIGDYVLSPEICVERKSLLDLIGKQN